MGVGRLIALVIYALGVAAGAAAGFFSPWHWLGFIPLAAGLVWAAYDLVEVEEVDLGDASTAATTRR